MRPEAAKANCAAFVLAGGKSTRMGTDKAFVMLDGRTLLERALILARSVTSDVRVVGDASKFREFAPVIEDIFANCGPLGGIHAALRASDAELNLVLAVDVPFVPPDLLRYLIARAGAVRDSIAIVPRTGEGWQPLCAVYRREFADAAEAALNAGNYKIDTLFRALKMDEIQETELAKSGFSPQVFCNLNTRQELAAARAENQEASDAAKP
jgi:molybdenum cofactor guanylyltransferase